MGKGENQKRSSLSTNGGGERREGTVASRKTSVGRKIGRGGGKRGGRGASKGRKRSANIQAYVRGGEEGKTRGKKKKKGEPLIQIEGKEEILPGGEGELQKIVKVKKKGGKKKKGGGERPFACREEKKKGPFASVIPKGKGRKRGSISFMPGKKKRDRVPGKGGRGEKGGKKRKRNNSQFRTQKRGGGRPFA